MSGMITMSGHMPITTRAHATNRLFGRDDFFVNEDICQRKVQQRSPVHSYGVFNPSVGLPSPSLQEDEVWGIDLAPIAMGSTLDPRPGPTDDAFTVNPNGALVGDGRPGARSIDGMVAKQQAKQKLGGSFSREKKYLQYASLADETQVVSSTSSPFEAERKAETVYYMWAEDTPGPGTYDPAPLGSLQFPSAEQIEALPKARKAKLGLPKEQWEQPSQYEPPREMKKLVTGSRSERFTFGAATGIHQHDLARPAPTMTTGRFMSENLPSSALVKAGWGGEAASSFVDVPTTEKIPRHSGVTRMGRGGLGGLQSREVKRGDPVGPSSCPSMSLDFPERSKIPGLLNGFEIYRRTDHRGPGSGVGCVPGGVTQHSFSSGAKDSSETEFSGGGGRTSTRSHHLKVCHLKGAGSTFAFLHEKQKARAAAKLWGAKTRLNIGKEDLEDGHCKPFDALAAGFTFNETPEHLRPKGTFGLEQRMDIVRSTQRDRHNHGKLGEVEVMSEVVGGGDVTGAADPFGHRRSFNATSSGPLIRSDHHARQPFKPCGTGGGRAGRGGGGAAVFEVASVVRGDNPGNRRVSIKEDEGGEGGGGREMENRRMSKVQVVEELVAIREKEAARVSRLELMRMSKTRHKAVLEKVTKAQEHRSAVDRQLAALLLAEAEAGGEGSGWLPSMYTTTADGDGDGDTNHPAAATNAGGGGGGDSGSTFAVPPGATFKDFSSTLNATPKTANIARSTPTDGRRKTAAAAAAASGGASSPQNKNRAHKASSSSPQNPPVLVPPPSLPPRVTPPSMTTMTPTSSSWEFPGGGASVESGSVAASHRQPKSVASSGGSSSTSSTSTNPKVAKSLLATLQTVPKERKTAPTQPKSALPAPATS